MTTNDASDTDEFPGWVPTATHERAGRPGSLLESVGGKGTTEGAGSGGTSTGEAVGDVGDAVDVSDVTDDEIDELAEWLDDEDDDEDFERDGSEVPFAIGQLVVATRDIADVANGFLASAGSVLKILHAGTMRDTYRVEHQATQDRFWVTSEEIRHPLPASVTPQGASADDDQPGDV